MNTFLEIVMILIGVAVYLLPTFIACHRKHRNTTSILIVNIFLGWTFIIWVAALAWAFSYQLPKME